MRPNFFGLVACGFSTAFFCALPAAASAPQAESVIDDVVAGRAPKAAELKALYDSVKDPQDKIELRKFVKTYKPRSGLVIDSSPWRMKAYQNEKLVYDAAWISLSPQALWLNGKILTGDSKDPSFARRFEKLMTGAAKKKAASFESLFVPDASAQEAAPELKNIFLMYTLSNRAKDAAQILALDKTRLDYEQNSNLKDILPPLTWWESNVASKRLACTAKGIEPVTYSINGQKYTLTAKSPSEYEVSIAGATQKYVLKIDPDNQPLAGRYDADKLCNGSVTTSHLDAGRCLGFWKEYLDAHPTPSMGAGAEANYKCADVKEPAACESFFKAKYAEFNKLNNVYSKDSGQLWSCRNESCSETDFLKYETLGKILVPDAETSDRQAMNHKFPIERRDTYLKMGKIFDPAVDPADCTTTVTTEKTTVSCKEPSNMASLPAREKSIVATYLKEVNPGYEPNTPSVSLAVGFHRDAKEKAFGLLVMSDCCKSSTCAAALKSDRGIDLRGAPTGNVH